MGDSIRVSGVLPVGPSVVLRAWLDSAAHSAFTGGVAFIEPVVGGRFSAWDGYIEGTTLMIDDGRIVQAWRTSEFPTESPDSRLEVSAEATDGGTLLTLVHTEIPEGQGERYEEGWLRWYLQPMLEYFVNVAAEPGDYAETGEFPIASDEEKSVERERSSPPSRGKAKASAKAPQAAKAKAKAPAKAKAKAKAPAKSKAKAKAPAKSKAKAPTNAKVKAPAKAEAKAPTKARAKAATTAKAKAAIKAKVPKAAKPAKKAPSKARGRS